MNNPNELDQLKALIQEKEAYWKNECAKLMTEVNRAKNAVDRLESHIHDFEEAVNVATILKNNAALIKDPRMSLQTDCYLVPLDDIESLRGALAALDEKEKK